MVLISGAWREQAVSSARILDNDGRSLVELRTDSITELIYDDLQLACIPRACRVHPVHYVSS